MRRDKKWIMIGTLCVIMVGMVLGYSTLNQLLNISGVSQITADWRIEITDVKTKETHGSASNVSEPTFNKLTASMSANLEAPGDYIIYDITVSNLGNIDAVLDSIKMNMKEQKVIEFMIEGISSKEELLVGKQKTFQLKIKYSENITSMPEETNFNFKMDLNYLQRGNESNFTGATEETNGELAIQSLSYEVKEDAIKTTVTASNAIKYYYSLDNDKWYETTENYYTFYNLKPYTIYRIYIKAEDQEGNVVYMTGESKTTDETKPTITFSVGNNVLGNNGWYKGITINSKITDNVKVAKVLSCTTTGETCNPTTELTRTNNVYSKNLTSNISPQKVCVKAIDTAGNENTSCSNSYKVDNTNPKMTGMSLSPNDDTMTIEVTGRDAESGVKKYYYSKDSGATYIESDNFNYTFTSLEEGEYLVNVYVEDEAGNKSEIMTKTTTIKHKGWCEKQGITDLAECVIKSETKNLDLAQAKLAIESKGTPNFDEVSPSVQYEARMNTNTDTFSYTGEPYIASTYTIDQKTGNFILSGGSKQDPTTLDYTVGKSYYTCGESTKTSCMVMAKIVGATSERDEALGKNIYTITKYNYNLNIISYDNSEAGMYATPDDEGTSYYYRGAVGGNYVKFADKYWRIIRVNGDGSVRMIYDGTSIHENGESGENRQIGQSSFNSNYNDNAYVGYMWGNTDNNVITESTSTYGHVLSTSEKYYFGDKYIYDKNTNTFKLDPNGRIVQATTTEYRDNYINDYLYTCFSTDIEGTCQRLERVQSFTDASNLKVKGVEYSSTNYEKAHANEISSTMKNYLDEWYDTNLSSSDDKISRRASFCNNRSIAQNPSGGYQNTGYGITPTMYQTYEKVYGWAGVNKTGPNLVCPQNNDKFTISTETGNGALTKPIGLITADEVLLAGGQAGAQNRLYYLYNGQYYWTMSPSYFHYTFSASEFVVTSAGELNVWTIVSYDYGVRPVINIDSSKVTFTGTGTIQDPYVIS